MDCASGEVYVISELGQESCYKSEHFWVMVYVGHLKY